MTRIFNTQNRSCRLARLLGALAALGVLLLVQQSLADQYLVYPVKSSGATTQQQVNNLATALNIDPSQIQWENGQVSFIDPTNFIAVPTIAVTDPAVTNLYGGGGGTLEPIDWTALNSWPVLATNVALNVATNAIKNVELVPSYGSPTVSHTTFWAV